MRIAERGLEEALSSCSKSFGNEAIPSIFILLSRVLQLFYGWRTPMYPAILSYFCDKICTCSYSHPCRHLFVLTLISVNLVSILMLVPLLYRVDF